MQVNTNITSSALRTFINKDPQLARDLEQGLLSPPLRLFHLKPVREVPAATHHASDVLEEAYLELLRWRVEAPDGSCDAANPAEVSAAEPRPPLLHRMSLATASPQWQARLQSLEGTVLAARSRYFERRNYTDEDILGVLQLALYAARPNWLTRLKVDMPLRQELGRLIAIPLPPEVATATTASARPPLGDLVLDDHVLFIRLQTNRKVEREWRLVLGAAALAARYSLLAGGGREFTSFGILSARFSHLLTIGIDKLFPTERLDDLAHKIGKRIVEADWAEVGRAGQLARLPGKSADHQHPILALQVVNSHAKVLEEGLRTEKAFRKIKAMRQQQSYLYIVKERAARVLLERGMLRPTRIDRGMLLAVGDTPLGPRGFHLSLERFGDFAAQVSPQGSETPYGKLRDALAVQQRYDLDAALQVLTRLIATKGSNLLPSRP